MEQDFDIVSRFQKGDSYAFDELFRRYKDPIYRLACRLVDVADAEDVVSDVFIRVHRSLLGFRGASSFKTWLYRIALNSCRDRIRRARREPVAISLQQQELNEIPDSCIGLEVWWAHHDVEGAMKALSTDERTAIELHYSQGLTLKEIAEVIGRPLGTIKARHYNALRKLRDVLSLLTEEDVSYR